MEAGKTPSVGSKSMTTRRIGGAEREVTSEVTKSDPPTRWAVHGIDRPIRATVNVTVEPLDGGAQSRVTIELPWRDTASRSCSCRSSCADRRAGRCRQLPQAQGAPGRKPKPRSQIGDGQVAIPRNFAPPTAWDGTTENRGVPRFESGSRHRPQGPMPAIQHRRDVTERGRGRARCRHDPRSRRAAKRTRRCCFSSAAIVRSTWVGAPASASEQQSEESRWPRAGSARTPSVIDLAPRSGRERHRGVVLIATGAVSACPSTSRLCSWLAGGLARPRSGRCHRPQTQSSSC